MKNTTVVNRQRMPDERKSITHKFTIRAAHREVVKEKDGSYKTYLEDVDCYIIAGVYPDGRLGEVFFTIGKHGGTFKVYDSLFIAVSVGLQYGIPLDVFSEKFRHSRFEPYGFTENQDIPVASSVIDYVFNWLGRRFPNGVSEELSERKDI